MRLNWQKWGYDFLTSLSRHIGTAGLATLSTSYVNGRMDWKSLTAGIVCGGIIPTVFTFLQANPLPEDEDATKDQPKQ